jgi:putative transcription factor
MMDARNNLKLSQKDIAQKVNEKPSVIQDYESGKAIPNPQILGKLERALGVKLRGMLRLRYLLNFV